MADRPYISFEQSQAAMKAMVEKAPEIGPQPVAMTIVDDTGDLVAYAHMDKLRVFGRRHSQKKGLHGRDYRPRFGRLW